MKRPDIDSVTLRMENIWKMAEERIMTDIIRRIKKTGKITSTADYQINRLIEMGRSTEEIERILKETLDLTYPGIFELYDNVSNWQYVRNKDVYEQVNGHYIPPEENEWLKQVSFAIQEQTRDELSNLARSYGFSVLYGNKKVFTPFSMYYQQYVDSAIMDVLSGSFDYSTVIRRTVTQMTNSGLRVVDYATGKNNRVDVAVRRSIMTGISQITGKINEKNAEILGTEYFEVDWHAGSRPEHRVWQGKVYSYKELETVCGLHTVTGLCGANCRHLYFPFVPGASKRMYSDEWLEEQNRKEAETKSWNGKEYDAYGQTQKQRKMEAAMRAQREKVRLLEKSGVDPDEIMLAKAKYQAQLNEYTRFCKRMNLPQQRERIYYDMRGRVATNSKKQNSKYSTEMLQNAGRDKKQYERYKSILGDSVGNLADFRKMKYNDKDKFEQLKKKADTYSEINRKDWTAEFKKKSKAVYDKFAREKIYLSTHALSRLPRLNKPGYPSIEESDVLTIVKGNPNYSEGESKLLFFDSEKQLVVVKNKETDDIVSIVRRKMPKEVWECV